MTPTADRDSRRMTVPLRAGAAALILYGIAPNSLAAVTAATPFAELCAAAGVVKCVGFDAASEINPYVTQGNGAAPTLDTSVRASGAGSMRMTYASGGAQATGKWQSDLGRGFGQNTNLYFAFKQRFSPGILSGHGGNGWKQFIVYGAPNSPSCAQMQLVTENTFYRGFPIMYSQCGAQPFRIELPDGDIAFQQGPGLDCRYRERSRCAEYVSNNWITFYYEVELAGWGQRATNVRAYMAYEGQAFQQWIDMKDIAISSDGGSGNQFQTIQLTMYTTDGTSGSTSNAWYDDFIVSTERIYDVDASPPLPPTALTAE